MPAVISDYYKSIQGYFDWEHLYDEIAERLPEGGKFCEVGTWKGQSLSYLLTKLQELEKDATPNINAGLFSWIRRYISRWLGIRETRRMERIRVWGVDHFKGSVEDPKLRIWADRFDIQSICRENLDIIGYPYELIAAKSVEGAERFADGELDVCFIDGSHDYDSVMQDLKAWTPKVKRGGLLAGHDINQDGVRLALKDFFGEDAKVQESPRPQELGGFRWGLCWKIER